MKSARHQAILDLIEKYPIDRQEDLLEHLRRAGFDVTQATVSRDIRELRLVKTATGEGGYRYMPANGNGKVAHSQTGLKPFSGSLCSRWTMLGIWYWSNAFPAWRMPPVKFLTLKPGKVLLVHFPVMIRFLS